MINRRGTSRFGRISLGLLAGAAIAYLDNGAFRGEVSPILVLATLLLVAALAAGVWGRRAVIAAVACWACLPLTHIVKHALGLPDTLQPNTYLSIAYLAAFSLLITAAGVGVGLIIHRSIRGSLR
jgi:hypothetical protein